jgi:hypothetical protein
MGTKDAFADDKTERICGNLRDKSLERPKYKQALLEVSVDWEKQPSVAFPEVQFAAGQQAQGLASILHHPWFLLGVRDVDPQLDSHWRHLFRRTAPSRAEETSPNCFSEADDCDGKMSDGRTVKQRGTADASLPVPAHYAELGVPLVQNLGKSRMNHRRIESDRLESHRPERIRIFHVRNIIYCM